MSQDRLGTVRRSSRSGLAYRQAAVASAAPTHLGGQHARSGPIVILAGRPTPGLAGVQQTFFDVSYGWQVLPEIAKGLWLNIRIMVVCEICILILAHDPGRRSAPCAGRCSSRSGPPRRSTSISSAGCR